MGGCAGLRLRWSVTGDPKLRLLRPAFEQVTAVRPEVADHRKCEVHESRDYAVAAVSVLVRELVGAPRMC